MLSNRARQFEVSGRLAPVVARDSSANDSEFVIAAVDLSSNRSFRAEPEGLDGPDAYRLTFGDLTFDRTTLDTASVAVLEVLEEQKLWDELRQISESLESTLASPWTYGAVAGMGVVSAGYLLWAFQAGSLVTTALSTLPVWGSFDPLPVLEFWERESKRKGQQNPEEDDPYLHSEAETGVS
jgi:hypothetical protein